MVNYSLGKIYEIVCLETGKRYIGSTTRANLRQRLNEHVAESKTNKNCSSKEIILGAKYEINLLEFYPCETGDELRKCEGKWISNLECVNKHVAGRTKKEYSSNKEKMAEQRKKHYEANKESILEKNRLWRELKKNKSIPSN